MWSLDDPSIIVYPRFGFHNFRFISHPHNYWFDWLCVTCRFPQHESFTQIIPDAGVHITRPHSGKCRWAWTGTQQVRLECLTWAQGWAGHCMWILASSSSNMGPLKLRHVSQFLCDFERWYLYIRCIWLFFHYMTFLSQVNGIHIRSIWSFFVISV